MSRSVDETRREFLKRLARAAAFVPPALVTLRPSEAGAQKSKAAGQAAGQAAQQAQQSATQQATAVGGTTPAAQTQGNFRMNPSVQGQQQNQPWDPGRSAGTPPWAKPPPTAGGDD